MSVREVHRLRVFKNKVLKRIFRPKRKEVVGSWRGLHNVEPHNLYTVPNTIRVMESRRIRWVGHVARMRAFRNADNILVGKYEEKRQLGRPRYISEIILKWILRKECFGCGLDLSGLGQ
jgi:hypothetical protein